MIKEIDNTEIQEVLEILEQCPDEELSVELLGEFNDCTKELGLLIMNRDQSLPHEEWEQLCARARQKVDAILARIQECKKSF